MIYTFVGHWHIVDRDLKSKLGAVLTAILEQDGAAEFLCAEKDAFTELCIMQLQKLSAFFSFQTTLICAEHQRTEENEYDKVCCPLTPSESHFTVVRKRLDRWRIDAADICICYVYPKLGGEEARLLQYVQKREKQILKLTNPSTEAYIAALFTRLGERERFVVEGLEAGKTGKEIGAVLGLSSARVFQIENRACVRVRWTLMGTQKGLR